MEEHRTGHMTDKQAIHALDIENVQQLILSRILLGHDLSDRPDFHPLRDELFRRFPDIKAAHDRARSARQQERSLADLEAAE